MIVYLTGKLHYTDSDHVVIVTRGVGYQVFLSKPSLDSLPNLGTELEFHIHSIIREDSHQLYGFRNRLEKELFLKLIQVSSIGPKLALAILSGLPAEDLAEAIHHEDLVRLTAIPGIGKKTAERLIVDLKDKILKLINTSSSTTPMSRPTLPPSASEEAISALINLGYTRHEASKALQAIPNLSDLPLEVVVREGLKALS